MARKVDALLASVLGVALFAACDRSDPPKPKPAPSVAPSRSVAAVVVPDPPASPTEAPTDEAPLPSARSSQARASSPSPAAPGAPPPEPKRRLIDNFGFPEHPSLRPICGKRFMLQGGTKRSSFAFGSNEKPTTIRAFYKKRMGARGFEPRQGWRLPPGAPSPRRTLKIHPGSRSGYWTRCKSMSGAKWASIVEVARFE